MTIVDLTHPITCDMPVYPGGEQPALTPAATLEGQGFCETRLCFCSHNGTHVDAPAHLLPGGRTLDDYQPEAFIGPGIVVDAGLDEGRLCDLLQSRAAREAEFVLFRTGHGALWGQQGYFSGWAVPPPQALRLLADRGIKGIGIDALSIDPVDDEGLRNHHIALRAGLLVFENLAGLDRLPPQGFIFASPPLKYRGGDGAPVRALGVIPA